MARACRWSTRVRRRPARRHPQGRRAAQTSAPVPTPWKWLGRGPAPAATRTGARAHRVGRWTTLVDDWPVPYGAPAGERQPHGGVRWLRALAADGSPRPTVDEPRPPAGHRCRGGPTPRSPTPATSRTCRSASRAGSGSMPRSAAARAPGACGPDTSPGPWSAPAGTGGPPPARSPAPLTRRPRRGSGGAAPAALAPVGEEARSARTDRVAGSSNRLHHRRSRRACAATIRSWPSVPIRTTHASPARSPRLRRGPGSGSTDHEQVPEQARARRAGRLAHQRLGGPLPLLETEVADRAADAVGDERTGGVDGAGNPAGTPARCQSALATRSTAMTVAATTDRANDRLRSMPRTESTWMSW